MSTDMNEQGREVSSDSGIDYSLGLYEFTHPDRWRVKHIPYPTLCRNKGSLQHTVLEELTDRGIFQIERGNSIMATALAGQKGPRKSVSIYYPRGVKNPEELGKHTTNIIQYIIEHLYHGIPPVRIDINYPARFPENTRHLKLNRDGIGQLVAGLTPLEDYDYGISFFGPDFTKCHDDLERFLSIKAVCLERPVNRHILH